MRARVRCATSIFFAHNEDGLPGTRKQKQQPLHAGRTDKRSLGAFPKRLNELLPNSQNLATLRQPLAISSTPKASEGEKQIFTQPTTYHIQGTRKSSYLTLQETSVRMTLARLALSKSPLITELPREGFINQ